MPKKAQVTRTSTIPEVCAELDIADETVRRDLRRGAPHSRGKRNSVLLNIPEYATWRAAQGLTGERGRPIEGDSPHLEAARLRKENALASKYELQVQRERGELVAVEEIKRWIGEHVTAAKNKFIGFGAGVTPQLEGRDAAERQGIIDARVGEILNELAAA